MEESPKTLQRVHAMSVSTVYPLYIAKATRKGRTKDEVDQVMCWLTGFTQSELEIELKKEPSFEDFFEHAPGLNPNRTLITGVICGDRIENIQDTILREVRYLDKLIDELAQGKTMDKILRSTGLVSK